MDICINLHVTLSKIMTLNTRLGLGVYTYNIHVTLHVIDGFKTIYKCNTVTIIIW